LKLAEYIPLALLGVLLGVLLRRRAWRSFPWFFAYVAFAVAAGVVRFVLRNSPAYFWTYWSTEAGYALLGIAVMYEVFRRTLGNLGRWWWLRALFPLLIAVSVLITISRATSLPVGLQNRLMVWIIFSEIAVRFLQVLMFATLVTLVPVLGVQWRQYAFGIAMGFGFYSTVALLTTTRFSILGQEYVFSWGWALIASYSCAVLIWLLFFSAVERPSTRGGTPALSLEDLKLYRKLLRRINR
jgi:hypothetical protein